MAFPTDQEVKKNSKAIVFAALRGLPSEQVHKLTDGQYPTVKRKEFRIRNLSKAHNMRTQKHNVMRKSITKVYKCLALEQT